MNDIIESKAGLPAHIAAAVARNNAASDLSENVGGSFPHISIRGRVWRLINNKEEEILTAPGTDDPAASLEAVILRANPALSKVYYPGAYVEGSDAPPTCFSNDGIAPDDSVEDKQSERCNTCRHNVWGSKITPAGTKVKACTDSRRLAVAPAGDIGNPMLLRVPAASLAALSEYGRALQRRGVPYHLVVTRLGFDPATSYPKLTFKARGYVTEDMLEQVTASRDSPVVDDILGVKPAEPRVAAPPKAAPVEQDDHGMSALDGPAPGTKAAPAAAVAEPKASKASTAKTKPAAEPKLADDVDDVLDGFDV